jgi:hypothetical protein
VSGLLKLLPYERRPMRATEDQPARSAAHWSRPIQHPQLLPLRITSDNAITRHLFKKTDGGGKLLAYFRQHLYYLPSMLIAREATAMIVTSEMMLSNIINSLARKVRGRASVGLNAVAVQTARKR